MKWESLINNTRLGCENNEKKDNRNSYQRDYDRIIFSKEFRQLQLKTQVVPFPARDGTHTRLTHSLETATVGRSLGIKVAKKLFPSDPVKIENIGAAVSAASLAHDIGNPPLGHSGEDAISQYFRDTKGSKVLDERITKDQRFDFENIEGNAIGFSILTCSDPLKTNAKGGFGLTYTTLAAYSKYPNRLTKLTKDQEQIAYLKKAGLLKCDISMFDKVATKLELKKLGNAYWCRHPLAYLTEAADDICYAIVDLEDGYKNNNLSFEQARDVLNNLIKEDQNTEPNTDMIKDRDEIIGYLRAKAINALIDLTAESFIENENQIMEGEFHSTLVKSMPHKALRAYEEIKKMEKEYIYSDKNVLLTEAAGFVVLPGLIDILVSAAFEDNHRSDKIRDCLMKGMICTDGSLEEEYRNYLTLINIVKYVSLMTDNYAVKLYRELTGIQLPNY